MRQKIQQSFFCTNLVRNTTVSSNVPNRATGNNRIRDCVKAPLKPLSRQSRQLPLQGSQRGAVQNFSAAAALREAHTVLSATSTPGHRK